jgi:hypothetical protein
LPNNKKWQPLGTLDTWQQFSGFGRRTNLSALQPTQPTTISNPMPRYSLRTLLIVLALGPLVLAMFYWGWPWPALVAIFLFALWIDFRNAQAKRR